MNGWLVHYLAYSTRRHCPGAAPSLFSSNGKGTKVGWGAWVRELPPPPEPLLPDAADGDAAAVEGAGLSEWSSCGTPALIISPSCKRQICMGSHPSSSSKAPWFEDP